MRDAQTKGGTLESGTSKKEGFHGTSPEALGMGTVGPNSDGMKGNKPAPNPTTSAPNGHKIK